MIVPPGNAIHGRKIDSQELEDRAKFLRRMPKPGLLEVPITMNDAGFDNSGVLRFADLRLDKGQRRVWRGKTEIRLPRLSFDLLAALAGAAPNSLSTDELMDRVWDGAVVSPATVAKRIELVREALGDDSEQPRYIALVRGHGYRLIPAVTEETTTPAAGALTQRKGVAMAIAAVFGAAVAIYALLSLELFAPDRASLDKSIAVLPFVALSTEPGSEVFADGLTEELSYTLARLGDLKVTGRTSSFFFKGRSNDLREIGEMLDVAHVLEGSVRQSGGQLRITAQLISTEDGFQLWSESYDRQMSDIIEIQKDIARAVAQALRVSILDDRVLEDLSNAAISPEAYALYLKAVSLAPYGKTRGLGEAQALIERVTELAPNFVPGWNLLAAVHGRRLVFGDPGYDLGPEESMRISGAAVNKALTLDPESGEAYANLGGAAWVFEGNAQKAAPLIERALELDPWNLNFVSFAADFAKNIGRVDEALELEEVLVARDPLCETCRASLARSYLYTKRYQDAEIQFRKLQSTRGGHHWTLGVVLLLRQQPDRALESFQELTDFEHLRLLGSAMALHDLGQAEQSRQLFEQVAETWGINAASDIAMASAYVGEIDSAFDWLEQSLPEATLVLQTEFLHPFFDALRSDERWQTLLEQIGRAPQQLASVRFSLDAVRARLGVGSAN